MPIPLLLLLLLAQHTATALRLPPPPLPHLSPAALAALAGLVVSTQRPALSSTPPAQTSATLRPSAASQPSAAALQSSARDEAGLQTVFDEDMNGYLVFKDAAASPKLQRFRFTGRVSSDLEVAQAGLLAGTAVEVGRVIVMHPLDTIRALSVSVSASAERAAPLARDSPRAACRRGSSRRRAARCGARTSPQR